MRCLSIFGEGFTWAMDSHRHQDTGKHLPGSALPGCRAAPATVGARAEPAEPAEPALRPPAGDGLVGSDLRGAGFWSTPLRRWWFCRDRPCGSFAPPACLPGHVLLNVFNGNKVLEKSLIIPGRNGKELEKSGTSHFKIFTPPAQHQVSFLLLCLLRLLLLLCFLFWMTCFFGFLAILFWHLWTTP